MVGSAVFFAFCALFTSEQSPEVQYCSRKLRKIQPNFNGLNTLGTMKICSRQGQFEVMSVNHSARSSSIIAIFFLFFLT